MASKVTDVGPAGTNRDSAKTYGKVEDSRVEAHISPRLPGRSALRSVSAGCDGGVRRIFVAIVRPAP